MNAQELLVALIVLLATGYLVWKLAFAGRRPRRRPDVPVSRLRKRR